MPSSITSRRRRAAEQSYLSVNWSNPISEDSLNDDLVGRWTTVPHWQSGTTWRDLCGRNHGTLTNGPTWSPLTHPGGLGSLAFEGLMDQYVDIGSAGVLCDPLTWLAWIWPESGNSYLKIIGDSATGSGLDFNVEPSGGGGKLLANKQNVANIITGATALTFNAWSRVGFTYNSSTGAAALYINGNQDATATSAQSLTRTGQWIGRGGNGEAWHGYMDDVRILQGIMPASFFAQDYADCVVGSPRTLRRMPTVTWFVPAAGGGAFSLSIESGSFALSGSVVTLRVARTLPIATGSFTETGSNVSLLAARKLAIDAGSFTETGTDVTLRAARTIPISTGSFTLTGTAVSLLRGYPLTVGSGSFTLTGSNVTLRAARTLTIGAGGFTETGSNVTLRAARTLTIGAGSFTEAGQAVGLLAARKLAIASGSFTMTGKDVDFRRGFSLGIGIGSYTLTGSAVSFPRTYRLAIGAGSFVVTGLDVTLTYVSTAVIAGWAEAGSIVCAHAHTGAIVCAYADAGAIVASFADKGAIV